MSTREDNDFSVISKAQRLGIHLTMSSVEIAERTGKEHRNVMRDIRAMMLELYGKNRLLSFEQTVERANPSGGAPIKSTCFHLPKRECLILVSGYSVELRAKIIDRWMELEAAEQARQAQPALSPFVLSRLERLVLEHLAQADGHQARKNKVVDHFCADYPRMQATLAVEILIRLGALTEFRAPDGMQGPGPYFVRLAAPEAWLAWSRTGGDMPENSPRMLPWSNGRSQSVGPARLPHPSGCPVQRLAEIVEAILLSVGSQEAKDEAVGAMERLVAQQAPTSASGALYQVRLVQGAADLVHSWVPESSKGARVSEDYARRINDMAESVCAFLGAIGGRLPEGIQAHHSVSAGT